MQSTAGRSSMPSRGSYRLPHLSLSEAIEDPELQQVFKYLSTGDKARFQIALLQLAQAGNPSAELLLGEEYAPREKFGPFKPGKPGEMLEPDIVPDNSPSRAGGFSVSFSESLHWLQLASKSGSGEASEIVAQLIPRMLAVHEPSTLTLDDAERFHALAVKQGYDLEPVKVRCYLHKASASNLACSDVSPGSCPSASQLQFLRDAGVSGRLFPEGGASNTTSPLTMHPGGAPAVALVILDHLIAAEQRFPLPRHAFDAYIQKGSGWLVLPQNGPVLDRDLVLTPGADEHNAIRAFVQDIDGGHSGSYCIAAFAKENP